jgi:hypothetical protein
MRAGTGLGEGGLLAGAFGRTLDSAMLGFDLFFAAELLCSTAVGLGNA